MGFKLKAADGTPLEIADGDFYFNTKARARRMCLNSLSSDARRVYACLELATMGFQQELAVIMEGGEKRPLSPNDIRQQTGLLRQNVTRGLVELEDAGLAERKSPDGGALRKGQVLIYSWAVPRQPKKEDCNHARLQFPDWFPESWEPLKPIISRFKYNLIADEAIARDYIEEGAEVARAYKEAEIVTARFLEKVCAARKRAGASLYRKNRKNGIERTPSPTDRPLLDPAVSAVGRSVEDLEEKLPELTPPKPPPPSETKPLPEIGPVGTDIRKWLVETYALPTAPSTEVLAQLARSCKDEAGFEQFQIECAKTQNADPKSYRYFLPIARRCAEHRPEYEEALRLKTAKPEMHGFDEERLRRIVANVEESRKWR